MNKYERSLAFSAVILVVLLVLLLALTNNARADVMVKPGQPLPKPLIAGETYILSGGNYPGGDIIDKPITIKRSLTSRMYLDGTNIDAGQAVFNRGLKVYADGVTIDGRQLQYVPVKWGIRINHEGHDAIQLAGSNFRMHGVEAVGSGSGQGEDSIDTGYDPRDGRGWPASTKNAEISYCYFRKVGRTFFILRNSDNWLVEYNIFEDNESSDEQHGEPISMQATDNLTFRHNIVRDFQGTGGIVQLRQQGVNPSKPSGAKIYRNLFCQRVPIATDLNNGVIGAATTKVIWSNVEIYENTFVNFVRKPGRSRDQNAGYIKGSLVDGVRMGLVSPKYYNNTWYNCPRIENVNTSENGNKVVDSLPEFAWKTDSWIYGEDVPQPEPDPIETQEPTATPTPEPVELTFPLIINCGGEGDRFFKGGDVPAPSSKMEEPWASERYFDMAEADDGYQIPVPDGQYAVVLGFAETYRTSVGGRVFDIDVEGQRVEDYDIFAAAGANTATYESFTVMVDDGVLDITFGLVKRFPKISQIEVQELGPTPTPTPEPTATPEPLTVEERVTAIEKELDRMWLAIEEISNR